MSDDLQKYIDLRKRYGKGSFEDFNGFLKEHIGLDGQGGYLKQSRDENEALKKRVKKLEESVTNPTPPNPGTPTNELPTSYNGKEITGIIIKP